MLVDIKEAGSQFDALGELAWQDEEVVITKDGEPYLLLRPYRKRKFGALKGQIWIAPDFDETSQDIIDAFENSSIFPE